jgi:hypothetical protein
MVRETFEITTMKKPFFNRTEAGKFLAEAIDLALSWHIARPQKLNCFKRNGTNPASIAALN